MLLQARRALPEIRGRPPARGSPDNLGGSRWVPGSLSPPGNLSAPHAVWLPECARPQRGRLQPGELLPSPTALFMTQRGENLSTWSKQLISLLHCLGSSSVIIIPTKALVSVRLISTSAADTIIKAPGFLCSKFCSDEAHNVCFGGKTKHGFFFSQLLSCLLPSLERSGRSCQNTPRAAANRPSERGSRVLAGGQKPRDEARVTPRGGCWHFPGTSRGGGDLGTFPSLLVVWEPDFVVHPEGTHLSGKRSH